VKPSKEVPAPQPQLEAQLQAALALAPSPARVSTLEELAIKASRAGAVAVVKKCLAATPDPKKNALAARCAKRLARAGQAEGAAEVANSISNNPGLRDQTLRQMAQGKVEEPDVLCWAVQNNRIEMVTELLEEGTPVDARDTRGNFPLVYAVDSSNEPMVRLLLGHNPNVNGKYGNDTTYLGWAVEKGHPGIVEALLAKGADPNAPFNWFPLHPTKLPLVLASQKGNLAVVKALLAANGIDVNARDGAGDTALIGAAQADHPAVVEALLARKADPRITDNKGKTALDIARDSKNQSLVERLEGKQ
jgi:ankyrin repeat protein